MFVKQIDFVEAMNRAGRGDDVPILVPSGNGWEEYRPSTLQRMLEGCVFFRQVPAQDNPQFAAAVREMERQMEQSEPGENPPPEPAGNDPEPAGSTAEPTGKRVGASVKRKPVDTGKLLVLRNAGWSMKKIGEELHVSEATVWNYLKKMEEEKQDGQANMQTGYAAE